MTFHYRETPVEWRAELVSKARELIEEHGFRPSHAHAALEARPPIDWHKGRACIYILRTAFGLDWSKRINIIYVGDDATDEDAMKVGTALKEKKKKHSNLRYIYGCRF